MVVHLFRCLKIQWDPVRMLASTIADITCKVSQSSDQLIPGPHRKSTWWPPEPRQQGRRVLRMIPLRHRQKPHIVLVPEGCTNRPFFTIQVKSNLAEVKRAGIEQIGSWDPLPNIYGEQLIALNLSRIAYWIARGAEPSTRLLELLGLAGYLPVHPRSYLAAHRAKLATREFLTRNQNVAKREVASEKESSETSSEVQRPESVWRRGGKSSLFYGLP